MITNSSAPKTKCEFVLGELNRYAHFSHKEWGHLVGGLVGFSVGVFIAQETDLNDKAYGWQLEGTVGVPSPFLSIFLKGCVPALSGGVFSNLFSNFGMTIDVITKNKTLLSFIVDCCARKHPEQTDSPA